MADGQLPLQFLIYQTITLRPQLTLNTRLLIRLALIQLAATLLLLEVLIVLGKLAGMLKLP
jgi:hypothetical protein